MVRQPTRAQVLDDLRARTACGRKIVGVAVGSGLSARIAAEGHADFLLALSSGYFRQRGVSSLGAYLPSANSNQLVMDMVVHDVLLRAAGTPVIFGLNATDPTIDLDGFLEDILRTGCIGINNYPTVGLFDGEFRRALEESGLGYASEVEAIRLAHTKGMFTVGFVFTPDQAEQMTRAGADVVCCHLGLTVGGRLGAPKAQSLEAARTHSQKVLAAAVRIRPEILTLVYGGPIVAPGDMKWLYHNDVVQGYVGGSTFERVPQESIMRNRILQFKLNQVDGDPNTPSISEADRRDIVREVIDYVSANYGGRVRLADLCAILGYSRSTISKLFTQTVGVSFREYLSRYRLEVAMELIGKTDLTLDQIGRRVGFQDYSQFYRAFKKEFGSSPSRLRASANVPNSTPGDEA
ncbi:phosphoenolpyruvate hydrolase family protein [Actinomycetaceae bacterium L2_0104]